MVACLGRGLDRQPGAVEADQAVGELVLHRLELADELAELLSDLGVLDGEIERALRRAERAAGAGKPRHQRDVGEGLGRHIEPQRWRVLQRELAERRHREAGRGPHRQAGRVACDHGDACGRCCEDQDMRRGLRAFDERKLAAQACRRDMVTRPAAGSPSKAPSASATAALP